MSSRQMNAWAHGLTAALTTVADAATLAAARRLLTTVDIKLNINQGFATAKFHLPNGRPVRPRLLVEELTEKQWERIETALADRGRDSDTLSDDLADPTCTGGIPLIPAPSDISHTCPCAPDTNAPCRHSVAVGLLLADRLRTTPAPLFTLRGQSHPTLKKRLRSRAALAAAGQNIVNTAEATIPAPDTAAHIPEQVDLDLTAPRPLLTEPLPPPPALLPELHALGALAADAAHRAQALLNGTEQEHYPDTGSDLARFTALEHGAPYRRAAQDHLGLDIVGMGHLALAHAHGGTAGAAAYLHRFTVDHDILARAQDAIQPLRPAPTATVEYEDNHLTDHAAGIQLRFGPDGRWYPYRAPYGIWQPVPGPSTDPSQAYRAARNAARAQRRTR
ncbi:hypothetical protein [Streptomyces sp. NPDC054865]